MPSIVASDREFHGLAEVLGQFGVGHVGLSLGFGLTPEERKGVRAMVAETMRLSGRPLHLLDIQRGEDPAWEQMVREEGLQLIYQGAVDFGSTEFKLSEFNMYDYMPNWVQPLVGSPEERAAKLRDPEVRENMKRDIEDWPNVRTDWSKVIVLEVVHERNQKYEGVTINELAEMMGKQPLDAFLDLALDEGLETEFLVPPTNNPDEVENRRRQLVDPHTPHLDIGWRCPHQVPNLIGLACGMVIFLGPGPGDHDFRAGPL